MSKYLKQAQNWQFFNNINVIEEIKQLSNQATKLAYLSDRYPYLYVEVLESTKQYEKIDQYMAKCKEFENDPCNYSYYIHGYLVTLLIKKSLAGELKQGKPVF